MSRRVASLSLFLAAAPGLAQTAPATSTVGELMVRAVQHTTFVLTYGGTTIYVDPVGGGEAFAGAAAPDLILITDVHGDHLDLPTLAAVAREDTTIVAPPAVAESLGDVNAVKKVLANGETAEVAGVSVQALPMYNLTEERSEFHPKGRGNGYVLTLSGQRVYISGDTEGIPEMRALENIEVAFVCMNLPYTMDVEQAADAVLAFKPRVVFPYHYRGQGGVSDIEKFRDLVAGNPDIDVRLLDWYPDQG